MKMSAFIFLLACLFAPAILSSDSAFAEDTLVFDEEEERAFHECGQALCFDAAEEREYHYGDRYNEKHDPNSVYSLSVKCFYYNICPRNLTREDILEKYGGSLANVRKALGPPPPDAVPFVSVSKTACKQLAELMKDKETGLFGLIQQHANFFRNNEECATQLRNLKSYEAFQNLK
ncbi:MAG: hypothetical protein AAGA53_06695 [Pseudomonadota bacterium]